MKRLCLKTLNVCSLIILTGFLVTVLLSVVFTGFFSWFLPRTDHYRQDILQFINQQNPDVQVEAAGISGRWEVFQPELLLRDVRVSNPLWNSALTFSQLKVQVDILKSLREEKLIFSHVNLSDLSFSMVQSASGVWQLSTENADTEEDETVDIKSVVQSLWGIESLEIDNFRLRLKPLHHDWVRLPTLQMQGLTTRGKRKLGIYGKSHSGRFPLLLAEATGEPYHKNFAASGRLQIGKDQAVNLLHLFNQRGWIKQADISADLWFELQGDALDISSHWLVQNLELEKNPIPESPVKTLKVDEMSAKARLVYKEGKAELFVPRLGIQTPNGDLQLNDMYLASSNTHKLYLKRFDFEKLDMLMGMQWLPERVEHIISTMKPKGFLKDVFLESRGDDFTLSARAERVSVEPWRGVPRLQSVSGHLQMKAGSGDFYLDSRDLSTGFPGVFSLDQDFDVATGHFSWVYDDSLLSLKGEGIRVEGEYGQAQGEFHVTVPLKKSLWLVEPARLSMRIHLEDSDAKYRQWFIPDKRLSPELVEWLDTHILAGSVNQGDFIFHGPLTTPRDANMKEQIVSQLWLDLDASAITYHEGLPPVERIRGEALLDDSDFTFSLTNAESSGMELTQGQVKLVVSRGKPRLSVKSDLKGKASQLAQWLNAPLAREKTQGVFEVVRMTEGQVEGAVQVAGPIETLEKDLELSFSAGLKVVTLEMPSRQLSINRLSGPLKYSLTEGLSSRGLTGRLFGAPLKATVAQKKGKTAISFDTMVAIRDLESWSRQPAFTFFEGRSQVHGTILYDRKGANLKLRSDLAGISSSLPEPFFKASEDTMRLDMSLPLSSSAKTLSLTLDEAYGLQLLFDENGAVAGEILLSSAPTGFINHAMKVSGHLDRVDFSVWLDVFKQYSEAEKQFAADSDSAPWRVLVNDLTIDAFLMEGCELAALTLSAESFPDFWHVKFEQPFIRGALDYYQDENKPLSVFLSRLDLDKIFAAKSSQDGGEENMDVRRFVSMNVEVDQLIFQEKDLGFWQFRIYPEKEANLLIYDEITAGKGGWQVMPVSKGLPTRMIWHPEQGVTKLQGRLKGGNFSEVLSVLGFGKEITSKQFDIVGHLQWPGAPEDFKIESASGKIKAEFGSGSFTKIDHSSSHVLKLFGILDLGNLLKRLKLDFSDLTGKGFVFDNVKGQLALHEGIVEMEKPLVIKSPGSLIKMAGKTNLKNETLDLDMSVTLPLASNIPWIATLIATGAAGLWPAAGVFLVSHLFKSQVNKLSTFVYRITGSVKNPSIEFKKIFDSENKGERMDNNASIAPLQEAG